MNSASSVQNARTLRGRRTPSRTNGRTHLAKRTRMPRWFARLGRASGVVVGAALLWCVSVSAAFAQGGGGGGGGGANILVTKINAFIAAIQPILSPVAGLALLFVALAYVSTPIAREWAEQNKKAFGSIVVGLILATFIKDIVNFLTSI